MTTLQLAQTAQRMTLAQALYQTALDASLSAEQSLTRIELQLEQMQKAAVAGIVEPMRKLWEAECLVTLALAPSGKWVCRVEVPDGPLNGKGLARKGATPEEAVREAYEEWKRVEGLEAPEEMPAVPAMKS